MNKKYCGNYRRVKFFDCGHTVDKGNTVRHDAQMNWNEVAKA